MAVFTDWWKNFVINDNLQYTRPRKPTALKINCRPVEKSLPADGDNDEFCEQPLAGSSVFQATASIESHISCADGKDIFCLKLAAPEIRNLEYEPGDAIGLLPENSSDDVENILQLIQDDPDTVLEIVNCDPKKKYLPKFSTPRKLFTNFTSLRFIPLKQLLTALAENCSKAREKTLLEYLCSKEGADAYRTMILESGTTFFEILSNFPSCRPSLNVLLANLPRLLPRPYSIASSPSSDLRIVLSVLPKNREGVCTGMIRRKFQDTNVVDCRIYLRKSHGFRLPEDPSVPLVLVGPGTACGIFLGFLDHLYLSNVRRTVYLFTGFRYKREVLFEEDFHRHLTNDLLTKICVSFSREPDSNFKYVQENIQDQWKDLGRLITDQRAVIYECGDFKKMTNTVSDAFSSVLQKYLKINKDEAVAKLNELKQEKRYLQDVWS